MEAGLIALAVALAIGLCSLTPGLSQGKAASQALESIARQPEATGDIRTTMILALAFMEAIVIFGLLISFMLLGKI